MSQILISFSGPMKSGKSKLAIKVAEFLRSLGAEVEFDRSNETLTVQTAKSNVPTSEKP